MDAKHLDWLEGIAGAVVVCDANGTIVYMNQKAKDNFADEGGAALLGSSLLNCHPEPSRSKVREMLAQQQGNVYSIEKRGIKKLIWQKPWYRDGAFAGLVEFSLEVPWEMPHFVR
ncbi:MAG TPA: PAS domain-containing protein [bacterium]|nr:PAS domain-containing protein [bacterium]HPR89014.1 PAS domain-containing protein [bacterium]